MTYEKTETLALANNTAWKIMNQDQIDPALWAIYFLECMEAHGADETVMARVMAGIRERLEQGGW